MDPKQLSSWVPFSDTAFAATFRLSADGETTLVMRGTHGVFVTPHGVVSDISPLHDKLVASFEDRER